MVSTESRSTASVSTAFGSTGSREPVALLLAGIGIDVAPGPQPSMPEQGSPDPLTPDPLTPDRLVAEQHRAPAPAPSRARELDARLEAVLMIADGPMPLPALAVALDRPIAVVRQAAERLRDDYDGRTGGLRRGYELREVATGWRLGVRAEHADLVRDVLTEESTPRLSQAALETLAVVAYRQPITRGQIASIRAVSVDAVVRTLAARGLIQVVGRVPETGAALYGTTDELLVALGIGALTELPPIAPMLGDVAPVVDRVG